MAKGARRPQDGATSGYGFLARTLADMSRGLEQAHRLYWDDVNAKDDAKPRTTKDRGMSAAAEQPGPDGELLAACEAMDALSAEFNADPRDQAPGTPEDDTRMPNDARITQEMRCVLTRIERAPCTTLDGAHILARTPMREYPDILKELNGDFINTRLHRPLIIKLLGDAANPPAKSAAAPSPTTEAPAAPTDAPAAQDHVEALLAASEVADSALFDMETLFFEIRAEIDVIGHIATSERQVSPEVWRRIEDHLDVALDTLEETWKLA
jgi:hypothetical protein